MMTNAALELEAATAGIPEGAQRYHRISVAGRGVLESCASQFRVHLLDCQPYCRSPRGISPNPPRWLRRRSVAGVVRMPGIPPRAILDWARRAVACYAVTACMSCATARCSHST